MPVDDQPVVETPLSAAIAQAKDIALEKLKKLRAAGSLGGAPTRRYEFGQHGCILVGLSLVPLILGIGGVTLLLSSGAVSEPTLLLVPGVPLVVGLLILFYAWKTTTYPPANTPNEAVSHYFRALSYKHFGAASGMIANILESEQLLLLDCNAEEDTAVLWRARNLETHDLLPFWRAAQWFKGVVRPVDFKVYPLEENLAVVEFSFRETGAEDMAESFRLQFGRPLTKDTLRPFRKLTVKWRGEWLLWTPELAGLDEAFLDWHAQGAEPARS